MWSAKLVFQGNEDLFNTPECSWICWTGTYCRVLKFVKTFTRVSTVYHGWSCFDVWISGGYQPLLLKKPCNKPKWIQRTSWTSTWNCSCPVFSVCLVKSDVPPRFQRTSGSGEFSPPVADGYLLVSQGRGTDLLAGADLCRNTWQRMTQKKPWDFWMVVQGRVFFLVLPGLVS